MKFRWYYNEKSDLSIFDQIKENRQITDSFIHLAISDLPPISLMKDLAQAADRIIEAVRKNEKIMIYGHDDVDGITSTYILFDFLEQIGFQNHVYYIPNRMLETHGIPPKLIDQLVEEKFDLLITVDGGMSEFENVKFLAENGIETVITDHHTVQDRIPEAYALVNPKQKDCLYPGEMLAGVGVVYFLVLQMAEMLSYPMDENYLFWVAVGTVSDKVPLVGVNRILLKEVLDKWFMFDCEAFQTMQPYLIPALNYSKRISIIKFICRLLANGREAGGENLALYYLIAPLEEKEIILQQLVQKQRENEVKLNMICDYLKASVPAANKNCIISLDEDDEIESNLLGFSASQLALKYLIPVIFLKHKNGVIIGEGRCTDGFNLMEAFTYCKRSLIQFGGHTKAAGFTAKKEQISNFAELFEEYVNKKEEQIENHKRIDIDAVFSIEDFDKFDNYLQTDYHLLQPFGQGNRSPYFLLKNFKPRRDHGKIKLKDAKNKLDPDELYDVIFKLKGTGYKLVDHRKAELSELVGYRETGLS
ncbi:DHH family phosphoesterase [Candidatus Cloacimonadota bacterium]